MQKYSVFSLVKNAFTNHENWEVAWKDPEPKKEYDVIIVGGGGHGLATAYYLAKEHGITNVAILEKGWIGGGNVGRNTTILRSNYMFDSNAHFYEFGMKLWETLSQELNYNVMYSPRGIINLAHSDAQMNAYARRGNSMRLNGIDAILLGRDDLKKMIPFADFSETCRFPIHGGLMQPRGGTARHDAVAWGYARAADSLGVDILQNCEVTGITRKNGSIESIQTSRGTIKGKKVGFAVAGNTSVLWQMAELGNLPIESHKLQAFVTESIKPLLDQVVVYGVGGAHFYISQSDKGSMVFGGDLDWYKSYAQRGNLPIVQDSAEAAMAILPCLGRIRLLRHWAGVMDMTMDGSFFICKTPISNLYLNAGWNYGGFKASPASGWYFADLIANENPHNYVHNHNLERFEKGINIDERGAGPDPKLHG